MAKDDGIKQFWAGLFFLAGAALVAGVIFFIGYQRGFSEPRTTQEVLFDRIGGLTEGAPVRLSGVTVGIVEKIGFLDDEVMNRGITVRLSLYKKFDRQVRRCTQISIFTEGVLGAKYVELSRIPGDPPLDLSRPVMGEPMLDIYDLAAVLQDTASSFNETTRGINVMTHELGYISRKTKRLMDRIEQRVIDGDLFKVF